jgi:hypothetical protein
MKKKLVFTALFLNMLVWACVAFGGVTHVKYGILASVNQVLAGSKLPIGVTPIMITI